MPYIKQEERKRFEEGLSKIGKIDGPGQLNYLFTKLALHYLNSHDRCYQTINDIVGALVCCKEEFYSKVAVPYEEGKAIVNGDVYALTPGGIINYPS